MGIGGYFCGGGGGDVDPAPPSCADIKNGWSYTSAPPICRRGMDRDSCTFFKLKLVNPFIEIQEVCHVLTIFCLVPASIYSFYLQTICKAFISYA